MTDSSLLIEHGFNPHTGKFEGYYMYPELSGAKRLQLYNATLYLAAINVDANIYVAQYTITTIEDGPISQPSTMALSRLAGHPVGPVMTRQIIDLLRSELDRIIRRTLRSPEPYISPLRTSR